MWPTRKWSQWYSGDMTCFIFLLNVIINYVSDKDKLLFLLEEMKGTKECLTTFWNLHITMKTSMYIFGTINIRVIFLIFAIYDWLESLSPYIWCIDVDWLFVRLHLLSNTALVPVVHSALSHWLYFKHWLTKWYELSL